MRPPNDRRWDKSARMVRQQAYWQSVLNKVLEKSGEDGDAAFMNALLDDLDPYLTTNLKRGRIINELWNDRDYTWPEVVHPDGVYTTGEDGFAEFHIDETALTQLIVQTFYRKAA